MQNNLTNFEVMRLLSSHLFWYHTHGEGNGNPLQHSCLGNPMDRGVWRAIVHGVAKSQTWLSDWTELNWYIIYILWLPRWLSGEESACQCRSHRRYGFGRSHGVGNGNPLQYSCLGSPMDRRAWQTTILGLQKVRDDLVTKQQQQQNYG